MAVLNREIVRLEIREARLFGLDAPQKVDPSVDVTSGRNERLADLEALVRAMPDEDRAAFLELLQRAMQRQAEKERGALQS